MENLNMSGVKSVADNQTSQSADTATLVNSYLNMGVDLATSITSAIASKQASEAQTEQLRLQLQLLEEQNKKGNNITDYNQLLALMESQKKSNTGTYIAIGCGAALLGLLAYLAFKK